jgi:hypothetical protein
MFLKGHIGLYATVAMQERAWRKGNAKLNSTWEICRLKGLGSGYLQANLRHWFKQPSLDHKTPSEGRVTDRGFIRRPFAAKIQVQSQVSPR